MPSSLPVQLGRHCGLPCVHSFLIQPGDMPKVTSLFSLIPSLSYRVTLGDCTPLSEAPAPLPASSCHDPAPFTLKGKVPRDRELL